MGKKENKIGRVLILFIALQAFFIASCSPSISEHEAEGIAKEFVQEHVKFFVRNESSNVGIPAYDFGSISTKQAEGSYFVTLQVSAELGNETKKANVKVTVDKSGNVKNIEKLTT